MKQTELKNIRLGGQFRFVDSAVVWTKVRGGYRRDAQDQLHACSPRVVVVAM